MAFDPEAFKAKLRRAEITDDDLRELTETVIHAAARSSHEGPQTPAELHLYIRTTYGIDIPRVAVCKEHGHRAPFDFVCAVVFETEQSVFGMASRGGGKSFLMALCHHLKSRFQPGYWGATFGAVEHQAKRVYDSFVSFIDRGNEQALAGSEVKEPKISETRFLNGSKVEIFTATVAAVNGPHPNTAHSDEVEIMRLGAWKESQPVNTPIATPSGWRRLGDLELGDEVFSSDGSATKVTKIVDYGEADVYRVELMDGRSTICCGDHLWKVAGYSQRRRGIWKVMRASQMISQGLRIVGGYRFTVPSGAAVEYEERELEVSPYVMGYMLGDGSLRDRVCFRSSDPETVERIDSLLGRGHGIVTSMRGADTHASHTIVRLDDPRSMISIVESVGLANTTSHTKFIPDIYKINSRANRLELLRGILDADGCATGSVVQYATVSEALACDVREIVFSLGGRAILREKDFSTAWSSGTLYTLDISFSDDTVPFCVSRKVERYQPRRRTTDPGIRSITSAGREQVRCIGVDAPDATYRTTDYIVTHNSRNMAQDSVIDGTRIKAQNVGTSTRKWKNGRVDRLLKESKQLIADGLKPVWNFYIWCIFEVAQERPDCQRVDPDERKARLIELGMDPCAVCDCHLFTNDYWDDDTGNQGRRRTLADVCRGRFFRSRGYRSPEEIQMLFMQNDRRTWNAQQECIEAESEGLIVPSFSRARHGISNFPLTMANGPIFTGTDFGTTAAGVTLWMQHLTRPVEVTNYESGAKMMLPTGSKVFFNEIYKEGRSDGELGDDTLIEEVRIRQLHGIIFKVRRRWADIQAASGRKEWRKKGLPTQKYDRDFDTQAKKFSLIFANTKAFVVVDDCPMFCDEIEGWHRDENGNEVKEFNHVMSAGRYVIQGSHEYLLNNPNEANPGSASDDTPGARPLEDRNSPGAQPLNSHHLEERLIDASERDWRARLGSPV